MTDAAAMATPRAITPRPIEEFRDEVRDRFPDQTRKSRNSLRRAMKIAMEMGARTTADLTPEFAERFMAELKARGYGLHALRQYRDGMMRCCRLAGDWGYLDKSPFAASYGVDSFVGLRPGKAAAKIASPVMLAKVMAFMKAAADAEGFHARRQYVLASVVRFTGMAQADAVRLKVEDVDLVAGTLVVKHRKRAKKEPSVRPMPAELWALLGEWIPNRKHIGDGESRLTERLVQEIRELGAQGASPTELAKHFGVTRTNVRHAMKAGSWKGIVPGQPLACGTEDSPWVFPSMKPGSKANWNNLCPDSETSLVIRAGRSVGIEGLSMRDIQFNYLYEVVPAILSLTPHQAAPINEVSPILLGGPLTPPMVLGTTMEKLTATEFNAVQTLNNHYPHGMSWGTLAKKIGSEAARNTIRRLKERNPSWNKVILTPGEHEHGDCRIVWPK